MENLINRKPAVAGQFYAANELQLKDDLASLFMEVENIKYNDHLRAIIVPHAGYVFSGKVAAAGYKQINPQKEYKRIFIIASSHRAHFNGASIYNIGYYETPLGIVKVDIDFASKLIEENNCFSYFKYAHTEEHSLEVQLPFLQHHYKKDISLVPIVIGTDNISEIKQVAEVLAPYFNDENLFVISSDFSHFPNYDDAVKVDEITAKAIIENNCKTFLKVIEENKRKHIQNLATSICGWTSVSTVLSITETKKYSYKLIDYQNSGDNKLYGGKDKVVGYWAISVSEEEKEEDESSFKLSREEKIELLKIARESAELIVKKGKRLKLDKNDYSGALIKPVGAFVSLHMDGKLRGCIGRFQPKDPLYLVVREMAISAAIHDHRFNPVESEELAEIDYEISVLTPLKKIENVDEIEIGTHGIYIKKGVHSGTFLPQVATDNNWSLDEFLGYCAKNKAQIGWDGWKDAEIFTYEAIVFSDEDME